MMVCDSTADAVAVVVHVCLFATVFVVANVVIDFFMLLLLDFLTSTTATVRTTMNNKVPVVATVATLTLV